MIASIFLCAFGIRSSSTNHVSATLRINCTARVNAVPAVTVCVYFPLNFLSTSSYLKQPSNDHQVTQKLSSNDLRVILRIFLRRRSIEETRWRFQNRTFYQAYRATLYNMIFRINDLQVPDSVSAVDSVCFHLRPDAKGNAVARCGLTECSRRNSGSSEFRLTIRWIFPRLFRVFLLRVAAFSLAFFCLQTTWNSHELIRSPWKSGSPTFCVYREILPRYTALIGHFIMSSDEKGSTPIPCTSFCKSFKGSFAIRS